MSIWAKLVFDLADAYRPLIFILLVLALWASRKAAAPVWRRPAVGRALKALAVLALAVSFACAAIYLALPHYLDHIEADVSVIALNWLHGLPVHPDWTSGQGAYGLVYGPLLYQIIGAVLSIWKSVAATKLTSFLAYGLTIAVLLGLGLRTRGRRATGAVLTFLLLLAGNGAVAFWVRGDPFLILGGALGCLALVSLPPRPAAVAIGLLAGLSACIKIHGVLYLAPLAVDLVLLRPRAWPSRAQLTGLGVAAFAVGLGLPLGFQAHRALAYGRYLAAMARHGVSPRLLLFNVIAALALLLPYLIGLARARSAPAWPAERWRLLAVLGCMGVVCVIASKPGAGTEHLLPFIPVLCLCTLNLAGTAPDEGEGKAVLAAALATAVLPLALTVQVMLVGLRNAPDGWAEAAEARRMTAAFPGAEFGPSDSVYDPALDGRVAAALAGAPQRFSTGAWMDLAFAGVRAEDAPILAPCGARAWILPRDGVPFSAQSAYPAGALFSGRFRADFANAYRLIETGRYFSVWRCEK